MTKTELLRRQKISSSLKKQWASGERVYKTIHTPISRARLSEARKLEWALGLRKGASHTQATRDKISQNNAKHWLGKKRIGWDHKPRLGQSRGPEEIAKFRGSIKKLYDKRGRKEPLNAQIRKSLEYRLWRSAVFERDNYTCTICGARNGNGKTIILQADHIKTFALYPELRMAVDNGRTLCIDCHRVTPTYGRRGRIAS